MIQHGDQVLGPKETRARVRNQHHFRFAAALLPSFEIRNTRGPP